MGEFCIVETTASSRAEAELIADALVDGGIAACVQIVGPIRSVYRWQGKIERDEEFLCLIKSRTERFEAIRDCVCELHSYDEPQIIMLKIEAGSESYLRWISDQTREQAE